MTKRIYIFHFLLLISVTAFSQEVLKTIKRSELGKSHDFSYEKKWEYFKLTDTINVTIIHHLPAPAACGIIATASMTIVTTEKGDIFRIKDMCNISDIYKKVQTIKVAPAEKPPFGLTTPFTLTENPKTNKFEPSKFDLRVLKTTWGDILD